MNPHSDHMPRSSHAGDWRRQATHASDVDAASRLERGRRADEPVPFPVSERAVSQADGEA
jgi:hypothetical protein